MDEWQDPIETMEEYVSSVLAGEIVACKTIIAACKRHRKDLARQGDPDFPYFFDEEHARNVCNFFPTCVKHSIGKDAGKPFVLQPWQCFAVGSVFGWKHCETKLRRFSKAYISVARKNGKAQPLDSVLVTPTGTTTMGEIKAGDYLIGRHGHPVKVLSTSEVWKNRNVYKVTFSDGSSVNCDENHEWALKVVRKKGPRGDAKPYLDEIVMETKDLAAKELFDGRGARYRVPNVVFQGCEQELEIPPYLLGSWLGDGESSCGRIIGHEDDIDPLIEELNRSKYDWSFISNGCKPQHIKLISVLKISKDLSELELIKQKHIPEKYFCASVEQRVDLLRGLMDTDGSCAKSGQCEFTQKSGRLAKDVHRLLASLGVYASIKESDMTLNGKIVGKRQRILFFPPSWLNPFRLDRKSKRVRARKKDGTRKVVSVELVSNEDTKCVQVEGGVYLTENYVLTHNSTIAAAICLYAAGFDYNPVTDGFESVAQVVLAASKKEQADRVTMAECLRMREQSKLLKDMSSAKNKQITFQHNSGHIITVGSDRAFDGLNGSLIQIDELHAFRSNGSQKEFLDTMRTGSGARAQPLFLVTTTAGSTSSEIWKSEWSYATGVVTGEYEDDSYFTLSYELDEEDDPLDPDNWIKANPCLGVTLTKEFLEDQAKPAAADNLALNRFTRYHGNRLVSNLDTAFNLDQWDACEGNLSDWSQADAVGCGIDLGARDDLASLALVARFPTDEYVEDADGNENPVYRYEVRSYSYLAMDSVRDVSVKPFCDFVENQLLIRSRFPLSELERDCVRYCREFGCYQVAFDPYNAQQAGERISQEGIEAVTMAQSTRHFNEPIGELRAAISDGRLRHDGNKLLRWAVSNAVIVTDRQDRMMYAKNECEEKIDPVVAMTMAFARAVAMPSRSEGYFTF